MSQGMTAELALLCATDRVADLLRLGWPQGEPPEWSLTYGRHSVYATASLLESGEGRQICVNASTGFLPWKRRELHRTIALA